MTATAAEAPPTSRPYPGASTAAVAGCGRVSRRDGRAGSGGVGADGAGVAEGTSPPGHLVEQGGCGCGGVDGVWDLGVSVRVELGVCPMKADGVLTVTAWNSANTRIDQLIRLRDRLSDCIGCGCLSIDRCVLRNRDDRLGDEGTGPRR
jgi:hypothetical protein